MTNSALPCSSPRRARYQQQQAEARQVVRLRGAALLEAEQEARNKVAVEAPAVLGRFEAEARHRIAAAVRPSTALTVSSCTRSASAAVPCERCTGSTTASCTCTPAGSTCISTSSRTVKTTSGRRKSSKSAVWPDTARNSCTCVRSAMQNTQQRLQSAPAAAGNHCGKQCSASNIQQFSPAGTGLGPLAPTAAWQVNSCGWPCCSCSCHAQLAGHGPHVAPEVHGARTAEEASDASNVSVVSSQLQWRWQLVRTPPNTQPQHLLEGSGCCSKRAADADGSRRQLPQRPGEATTDLGYLPRPPVSKQHVACNSSNSSNCRQPPLIRYRCNKGQNDVSGSSFGSSIQQHSLQLDCHTKLESRAAYVTAVAEQGLLQARSEQNADASLVTAGQGPIQQTGGSAGNAVSGASAADGHGRVATHHGQADCAPSSAVGSQHAVQAVYAQPIASGDVGARHSISPRQPRSPIAQAIASCHAAAMGALHRGAVADRLDPMREPLLL